MEHFPTINRLHSDVLEEKYGPIHSEVLRHDDTRAERAPGALPMREVHLCDSEGVSRTYALTFLTYDKNDDEMYAIDSAIRDGGMIGKTFREHGFEVRKNVLDVFTLELSPALKAKLKTEEDYAKARFSEFYARRNGEEPIIYGRVLEVYTPDFRKAIVNPVDLEQVNPSTEIMEKHSINKDVIWDHLDRSSEADEWQDREEDYDKARKESLPEVFAWRNKVNAYLKK